MGLYSHWVAIPDSSARPYMKLNSDKMGLAGKYEEVKPNWYDKPTASQVPPDYHQHLSLLTFT
jgi:hypothetical protein